ncbi:MAG: hypothetical protein GC192_23475 [Bacteroidetes bacterium]|nr:hypothetical protein [Bacteroidota bacterium]
MRRKAYILIALFALALIAMVSGCNLLKKPKSTHEVNNYYKEFYRDSVITIPGAVVNTTLDSATYFLLKQRLNEKPDDTVVINNHSGISMKYYLDALGRITAECEKKDQRIDALIKQVDQSSTSTSSEQVVKYKNNWQMAAIGALSSAILILLIILFKRR